MTQQEHEAIVRNTLPLRADVAASWAQDVESAKGVVELPQNAIDEVSAAIEAYLAAQGHGTTTSAPAADEDPPLSEAQAVKALSDVAEFFGREGDDRPTQQEADTPLADVDRDVLRYFVRE